MLNLIPYPSGCIKEQLGKFILKRTLNVDFGPFETWCVEAFTQRIGLNMSSTANDAIWLKLVKVGAFSKEGYQLTVNESLITIHASTELGVMWALTTLVSLVEGKEIPCVSIEDSPRYPHRALSLDCARHFFAVEEVKKVIEEISLAKMNTLHWHLSDDQGWRIESKKFPKLNTTSEQYYTQAQIQEVVEFARIRGVEIIPEIDIPGHTSAILAAYPQYSCFEKKVKLATAGGIYPVILCAGKDETFTFLEQLFDEILPLFPSERFHIGGDEAPKTEWNKCPKCQERMKKLGLTTLEDLQGYFTARVIKILKNHGKQPICWNDTLLASNVPKDIQVQYWTLQHRVSMQKFVESGGRWIYSDMFEIYLDYPYSMTNLKKVYETQAHLGKKSFEGSSGFEGYEGCLWAEHITDAKRLENLLFPRIYALAELNWCGKRDYSDFKTRLKGFISSELHKNVQYTPEIWWEPQGRARKKEAIDYFIKVNSMPPEVKAQTVDAAAPNKEFASSFMNKFFKPLDIPALLIALFKQK